MRLQPFVDEAGRVWLHHHDEPHTKAVNGIYEGRDRKVIVNSNLIRRSGDKNISVRATTVEAAERLFADVAAGRLNHKLSK